VWEHQCARHFNTRTTPPTFKQHYQHFITTYGPHSVHCYQRITQTFHSFTEYCTAHIPALRNSFLAPASIAEIQSLKKELTVFSPNHKLNLSQSAYLIFLGECANGQTRSESRLGMYGYYAFYNKASAGHLLSVSDAQKYTAQVRKVYGKEMSDTQKLKLDNLWLFCAGIPTSDRLVTIPCLTFLDAQSGRIAKVSQDAQILFLEHNGAQSFLEHFEFFVSNLCRNNYRISKYGILRFPLSDAATSEKVTRGILCRASPLFVAEISNVSHCNYIFPYHIEIECPTTYADLSDTEMARRCAECPRESASYQLTERKWFIEDSGKVETVQGPGVIGLYPKVFVNQSLFEYESCSQQNQSHGGKMWGSFTFERGQGEEKETFEMGLEPYLLDWNKCQWI